jgi:hypothetical protein
MTKIKKQATAFGKQQFHILSVRGPSPAAAGRLEDRQSLFSGTALDEKFSYERSGNSLVPQSVVWYSQF